MQHCAPLVFLFECEGSYPPPRAPPCRLGACCPAAGTDTFDFFAGEASPAKEACHKIFCSVAQNKATNNHFFSISESVSFLLSLCYTERRMVMKSAKYSYWLSVSDLRRCGSCKNLQGKIFTKASSNPLSDSFFPLKPPLHPLCRCKIVQMDAKRAGTATKNGLSGVDW